MSDDHDALKKRERERPVEPPVIDVEPEVSEAEPDHGVQQKAATDSSGRRSAGASAGRILVAAVGLIVLLGLAGWALSAAGYRFNRDDERMAAVLQRIEALEKGIGTAGEEIARIGALATEVKSTLDRVSGETPQGLDEIKSRIDAVESTVQSTLAAIEAARPAASEGEETAKQIEALRGIIAALDEKVATLEKVPPSPPPAPRETSTQIEALRDSFAALNEKVAALEKAPVAPPPAPPETSNTKLAAALANLEMPLEKGRPFAAELDSIAGISPGLAGLEELRPHAATGVASIADLAARLQAMVDRETAEHAPAAAADDEQGLWDGLRSRISGLVKIRDLDQARWLDGMTAATRHLARGDSRQAVAVLQAIEGPMPDGAQDLAGRGASPGCGRPGGPDACRGGAQGNLRPAMIRFIALLAAIVALAGAVAWLADRPGSLTVDWLGYRIEMPVIVAAATLLAAILVLQAAYGFLRRTWQAPGAAVEFFRSRRNRRGYEALSRGIVAVGAGDLVTARKQTLIAARVLEAEPLTKVLEAQTAQLAGDTAKVQTVFAAMAREPETRLLGLRGLFRQAKADGNRALARKIAEQALDQHPGLPWASSALLAIQAAAGDWNGAARTLASQRRFHLIDETAAKRKQAVVLTAQAMELEKTNAAEALALALKAHRLDVSFVPAAMVAGRCYAQKGQARRAARLIEQTWSRHPHADLARIYAFQRPGAPAPDRLKRVRELVANAAGGEEGAVALAQAALEAREWPEAREALAPHANSSPNSRVCALMAEIAEGEGDRGLAREWLARAVRAPRGPQWTADGFVSDEWLPASPVTGELGAFQWKVPVEGLAIEAAGKPPALEPQSLPDKGEGGPVPETPVIEVPPARELPSPQPSAQLARQAEPPLPLPDDPGPPREEERARMPRGWPGRLGA